MPISEVENIDCMEGMIHFSDKFFDLCPADPPYFTGVGKMGFYGKYKSSLGVKRGQFTIPDWDHLLPTKAWFNEVKRVSVNQIIWGANYYDFIGPVHKTPRPHELNEWIEQHPVGWIVWDKMNGSNDFNNYELAWTSFDRPTIVLQLLWNGMIQAASLKTPTVQQGNKALNEKRIHPTQKPVILTQWKLENYATAGHKILSTHMGSQGDRIAAYKMGFDYWGFEIDPHVFSTGNKRFYSATHEPLFQTIRA